MKPGNIIHYVNKHSNHPKSILKNLPESINKRINTNSKNEQIFQKAKSVYDRALNASGYKYQLKYDEKIKEQPTNGEPDTNNKKAKRVRRRNITWFNPPFNKAAATNIGREFLNLVDYHFPKSNKLHQIINRNTIKISYSCLPNIEQIINGHNKKVLREHNETNISEPQRLCNCRDKNSCPLNGKCLTQCLVYRATVTELDSNKKETYIGLTENTFKFRYTQHKTTFQHHHLRKSTTLSDFIWTLKEKNVEYNIEWEIVKKLNQTGANTGFCKLCAEEKYRILMEKPSLNARRETFSKCLHNRKHLLSSLPTPN